MNVDAVPAAERAAAGLRDPGGPVAAPDFGTALIAVGVWQAVLYIALRGWPAARLTAGRGRALTLGLVAVVALALNRALAAYADGVAWTRATPGEWITTAALSFIGAGIILHVGVGLRWPFARRDDLAWRHEPHGV